MESEFEHQVERIRAAAEAIQHGGTDVRAEPETETVRLAGGAIVAVGLPMVTFLADRLDAVSLKRTERRLGHCGQ